MSKLMYVGALLLLIVVVLVSCSSFEYKIHHSYENTKNGGGKQRQPHRRHDQQRHTGTNKYDFKNKHTEFFDENFKAKPEAIRHELFKGQQQPQQGTSGLNATNPTPIGIALTFAPKFFQNLFNVIVMPQIRQIATNLHIGDHSFGLPGPRGQGSVTGISINEFNINIGELQPVYPSQFNWRLSNIDLDISATWSVKWSLHLCPCFGGCCFTITLLHCSGPVSINANNIEILGTMDFSLDYSTNTVSVASPTGAQWINTPNIGINGGCGWFYNIILDILKAFGLNIWQDLQNAINAAITKAFQGGVLGSALNNVLDDTVNAAFNGIKICDYSFYQGQSFMTIFTHETSAASSTCLKSILPSTWLASAPRHDITLLARIDVFPAFFPPQKFGLSCVPLPQSWFALPGSLGNMMRVDDVITCLGLDSNLGIYIVGEVDVSFFVSEEATRRRALPFIRDSSRLMQLSYARDQARLQQEVDHFVGEEHKNKKNNNDVEGSCPFEGALKNFLTSPGETAPWWACADIPLLESVLSWLPSFLILFSVGAFYYYKKAKNAASPSVKIVSDVDDNSPLKIVESI